MPCVRPDGTLGTTGKLMLKAVQECSSAEDIATVTGMALYRVRSSLRELIAAGYVSEEGERFSQTELGAETVKAGG
jgi:predicted transcriptional regulator